MSAVRGWTDAPLGHLVAIKKGRKVPTSLALLPGYEPYLGASALEAEPTEYAATKGAVRASESDLLLLWDGERSGLVGKGRPGVVASTVARLTTSAEIETRLVLHLLRWKFDWIQSQRTGTGVPHVPSDLAKRMRLRFPSSRTEQLRIADVLDNMDRIIEAAATLVAKLTALKHGVVADLLTRGIGPNGEIRNWKDDKEFKLSVIGPIPESWDVAGFGDIVIEPGGLKPGPFGSSLTKREFVVESQFRVYGQEQVLAGSLDHGDYFISESKYRELAAFSVMPRDLLVTMVGVGTIGKVLLVEKPFAPGVINPRLLRIRLRADRAYPPFVAALILSPLVRRQFEKFQGGGTMPVLNSKIVRRVRFALPSVPEQRLIAQQISAVDARIAGEQAELTKLRSLRLGLVDDLLGGRRRVPASSEGTD